MFACIIISRAPGHYYYFETNDLVLTYQELYTMIIFLQDIRTNMAKTLFKSNRMVIKAAIQMESLESVNNNPTIGERFPSPFSNRPGPPPLPWSQRLFPKHNNYFRSSCHSRKLRCREFYNRIQEVKTDEYKNGLESEFTDIFEIFPVDIVKSKVHPCRVWELLM